jgi:dynein heavy chain
MQELSQLGQFVRLADYLFVEAVMTTAVSNVEELLGVLTAHKQQVGMPHKRLN